MLGNDPDSHNSSALASKAILSSNRWPAARFGNAIIGTVCRPNNVTDDFQENSVAVDEVGAPHLVLFMALGLGDIIFVCAMS